MCGGRGGRRVAQMEGERWYRGEEGEGKPKKNTQGTYPFNPTPTHPRDNVNAFSLIWNLDTFTFFNFFQFFRF